MKTATIPVTTRKALGKSASIHDRYNGLVPAVIYGHGKETVHVTIPLVELKQLLHQSHEGALVDLQIDDTKKPIRAMIKEISRNALSGKFLHVDFQTIAAGELIEVEVSIKFEGEAPGVKEGGILNVVHHEIPLLCDADSIPDHLVVDLSEAHIGDVLRAGELVLPSGTNLGRHVLAEDVIYTVQTPHVEVVPEVVVEETPAEEEPELIRKLKEEGTEEKES